MSDRGPYIMCRCVVKRSQAVIQSGGNVSGSFSDCGWMQLKLDLLHWPCVSK